MADIIIWFTVGLVATFFVYFAFKRANKKDNSGQNNSVLYKIDKDIKDKEKDENRPILAPRRGRKVSSRPTANKEKKAVAQRQEKKEEIITHTDDSPNILDIAFVAAAVNELMDDDKESRSFTGLSSIENPNGTRSGSSWDSDNSSSCDSGSDDSSSWDDD